MEKNNITGLRLPLSIAIMAILGITGCASVEEQQAVVCTVDDSGVIEPKEAVGNVNQLIDACGTEFYFDYRDDQIADVAKMSRYQAQFERISEDSSGAFFSQNSIKNVLASQVSLTSQEAMFASDRADISDQFQLAKLRHFLNAYLATLDNSSSVYVVGHTDSTGSAKYNQLLSEQRAKFIADELVRLGLDSTRLYYEGVGQSQPIASNATKAGREANRRFELLDIISNGEPVDFNVARTAMAKKQRIENVLNMKPISERPEVPSKKPTDGRLGLGGVPAASAPIDFQSLLAAQRHSLSADETNQHIATCIEVEPVYRSKTINYATGEPLTHSKELSSVGNLFRSTWVGQAENTRVKIGPIDIKRETLESATSPKVSFFINNDGGSEQVPDYIYTTHVETYKGDNSVLLRMYPEQRNAHMLCSDVIFSTEGDVTTKSAGIFYRNKRKVQLVRDIDFKLDGS
ncbi:OmpA family protein [Thaumasiovibrio sp. DFM-14]|uniref:OmpA family protein n=1 Tax=Thaumasiovibrio sp. DFM-14 TaxID=3384792 RepID=UPI0039A1EBBC